MSTTRNNKKHRVNACNECRRRKVRCETVEGADACSQCTVFGTNCARNESSKKRGPKSGTRTFASCSVKSLVEDILKGKASVLFDLLNDRDSVWKVLNKLANHILCLEEEVGLCRKEHNHILSDESLSPDSVNETLSSVVSVDSDDTDLHGLAEDFNRTTLGLPQNTVGEYSNMHLVMTAVEHRKKVDLALPDWQSLLSSTKRTLYWNPPLSFPDPECQDFEFPSDEDLETLVNGYFTGSNRYCPLLHETIFKKSISESLHLRDPAFGALVLVVCANGSVFVNENYLPANEDPVKSGLKWFQQIPIMHFSLAQSISLYHLQMLCLAIIYLNIISGTDRGWALCGIAIRLCQERGIHRRAIRDRQPLVEQELWKRVFWTLIFLDTKMSMLYGRPRGTAAQEFDLEPLIECDDECWETENLPRFVQPTGMPCQITFWNCFLRLVEILGLAQESLYSVRKLELWRSMGICTGDWNLKAVIELDSALNKWISSVPDYLRWDTNHQNDAFFHQSAIIYSMYYWVQIQVHRKFIPRPGQKSDGRFPSLAICVNAARSCIRVIEICQRRKFLAYGHFQTPLFGSAMILAVNLWRGRQINPNFNSRNELTDIYRCIDLLRMYETRYILAGRLVDIINTVMSIHSHFTSDDTSELRIARASDVTTENLYPALPPFPSDLGQLPINHMGYEYRATDDDLSIFNDNMMDFSALPLDNNPFNDGMHCISQDWDIFMDSLDGLLATTSEAAL